MSDTRFTVIGVVLIFAAFLVVGTFGGEYQTANIEMSEFGECYDYSNDVPVKINCSFKAVDQIIFFGIVIALIAGGTISLIKAAKGKWDNDVKPEDMVGPSRDNNSEKEDQE